MKLRLIVTVILVGTAVVSLALECELHFGGNAVVATQRANVFNSEFAAATEGATNRPPITPITSIDLGEQVAVLWDTYGKDYWACYVRTLKGVRGWALCTSLRMGWEDPCSVAYWDNAKTSELTACETSARTGKADSSFFLVGTIAKVTAHLGLTGLGKVRARVTRLLAGFFVLS
jgi:hypothetical protein